MSRIHDLINALEKGRAEYEKIMESRNCPVFHVEEVYGKSRAAVEEEYDKSGIYGLNTLASGDNLQYMEYLLKERDMAGKIQLIYVDPPFFSNSRYQASVRLESDKLGRSPVIKTGAYDDRWDDSLEQYLSMLTVRFIIMRELLSDSGCLWVHLDWHGSYYVKLLLDEIFGEGNFRNEVAWMYKSGGASKRSFAKKHDTLLFFSKTGKYKFNPLYEKSYNRDFKPYRFKGVEEFQDELGWYTMVHMKDVWQIDMVGRTSAERTGYATQKPEKLLERIVESCSDTGDICADFFSGSGTLGVVAGRMNRRWIMCDEGDVAISGQIKRLCKGFEDEKEGFRVEREALERTSGAIFFSGELGCLRIENYKPDLVDLSPTDQSIALDYIEYNGISSVNFWSVDENYDGKVHRTCQLIDGNDFCTLPEKGIHVVGYDVFGNRFTWDNEK